ncbi:hypothetical protein LAZ67_21002783 [Cordylochernes scorpioides]|uniref:Uncharacterized protein n=1 Tax=Cordylochernes scorpioides TaxID=51811 RepID=A0ABY6LN73_9ARAC|nr:hypothetical protein LAZ67_21002783 [Cordylochernes scorpioides]
MCLTSWLCGVDCLGCWHSWMPGSVSTSRTALPPRTLRSIGQPASGLLRPFSCLLVTNISYLLASIFHRAASVLAERGAEVDCANSQGATPLHDAVHRGDSHLVRALLEAGANPHVSAVQG